MEDTHGKGFRKPWPGNIRELHEPEQVYADHWVGEVLFHYNRMEVNVDYMLKSVYFNEDEHEIISQVYETFNSSVKKRLIEGVLRKYQAPFNKILKEHDCNVTNFKILIQEVTTLRNTLAHSSHWTHWQSANKELLSILFDWPGNARIPRLFAKELDIRGRKVRFTRMNLDQMSESIDTIALASMQFANWYKAERI